MENYSVLMSVYYKDNASWLKEAIESMISQTLPPSQFVIVEDGPLSIELENIITSYESSLNQPCKFKVVRLQKNGGLGPALSEGLKHCENDLIARMDSDDISVPDRCQKQVSYFDGNTGTVVLSGSLCEFVTPVPFSVGINIDEVLCESKGLSVKRVPLNGKEIRNYSKSRNPFNHPCVMFRKSAVEKAGGYRSVPLFEDYDLWLRMIHENDFPDDAFANLSDILLLMRTDGMFERRGGIKYAKNVINFRKQMYKKHYMSFANYVAGTVARTVVSLMPASLRKLVYTKLLR